MATRQTNSVPGGQHWEHSIPSLAIITLPTIRSDRIPASLGTNVQEAARKNLNTRYTLLPYLYTLFYNHTRYGDPVLTSLKFNFPEDEATNSNDRQFMWGDGLLVNPVLEEGKTSVDAYFPAGIWYDYRTGHVLSEGQAKNVTLTFH